MNIKEININSVMVENVDMRDALNSAMRSSLTQRLLTVAS